MHLISNNRIVLSAVAAPHITAPRALSKRSLTKGGGRSQGDAATPPTKPPHPPPPPPRVALDPSCHRTERVEKDVAEMGLRLVAEVRVRVRVRG